MTTWRGAVTQFVVLFGFWLVLSDQHRPLFFAMGAVSAAVVTGLTHHIVATLLHEPGAAPGSLRRLAWFIAYVGWLLGRIIAASVQVAYFALHPGLPFEPRLVRFRTDLQRPLSRVALAVSITLVPGTVTVHLEDDEYLVHSLLPSSVDDLVSARMQNLIARFLGEAPQPAPVLSWHDVGEPVR